MAKKKTSSQSRLAFLLTGLLTSVMVLGAVSINKSTEFASQAANNTARVMKHTYAFEQQGTMSVPGITSMTAKDICDKYPAVFFILTVGNHENGDSEVYGCEDPNAVNFTFQPHVGYVVNTTAPVQFEVSYRPTTQPISYVPQYDIIGMNNFPAGTKASDVCATFAAAGHPFEGIHRMQYPQWIGFYCEYPEYGEEFVIEPFTGYLINAGMPTGSEILSGTFDRRSIPNPSASPRPSIRPSPSARPIVR